MTQPFSVSDLLDLPEAEREITLWIARSGAASAHTLANALGLSLDDVHNALDALVRGGHLAMNPDGLAEVVLGRTARRTTLPDSLYAPVVATQRLYSEQDIAILRTAIPMLQFARARLTLFSDHGPSHALRVRQFATQLGSILNLTPAERHILRAAALFHDVGNAVDRERHHIISQETVEKLAAIGRLPFSPKEAQLIGLVCRWHRGAYDHQRVDALRDEHIRTGLLATILRVADAMDIDHRRSDYDEKFRQVLEFFYPGQMPFWTSVEEIRGVRVRCSADVHLEVLVKGAPGSNIQVDMLRRDLASTPLNWIVDEVPVARASPSAGNAGSALLVFPFEAHSLIMAALSRARLSNAGHNVTCLCYPDTLDAPARLWRETLADMPAADYARLVVIGDQPDAAVTDAVLRALRRWSGVTILNRHEANWTRVPELLETGAEAVLGSDWAYFWGETAGDEEWAWTQIAAFVIRDPTLANVRVSAEDRAVAHGLLHAVYSGQPYEQIIDRIAANDRASFIDQARQFVEQYATPSVRPRVQGRVLLFDQPVNYWAMETACEQHGRSAARGIRYKAPYAVATWPLGDGRVELLAMNHWRDEDAMPIRLLYPLDDCPTPLGSEITLHALLTEDQARAVVEALVAACNADTGGYNVHR